VDTHSSGEATRVLVGGIPKLKGKTMVEKQEYFQKHYDDNNAEGAPRLCRYAGGCPYRAYVT